MAHQHRAGQHRAQRHRAHARLYSSPLPPPPVPPVLQQPAERPQLNVMRASRPMDPRSRPVVGFLLRRGGFIKFSKQRSPHGTVKIRDITRFFLNESAL